MENRVRTQWSRGQVAFSAGWMAQAGFAALTLDIRHGLLDFASFLNVLGVENLSPMVLKKTPVSPTQGY